MDNNLISTELLSPDEAGFCRASEIVLAGGLVALPTETVYGLGADARDDLAVARIFQAKDRPRFNPLIVHVASASAARAFVEWPQEAEILASAFWPGPLTLVLPLRPDAGLSPLVTAGLPTLAIRVPAHPVARAFLETSGVPLAAPSANLSGRISPTQTEHVMAGLSGRIEAIIDGGTCGVGIESTIVGLADQATLLRPGGLASEDIETRLGHKLLRHGSDDPLVAPGQMTSHYAPGAAVRLNADKAETGEVLLGFGPVDATLNLSPSGDLREAAANLFGHLHALDAMQTAGIAVSPIPEIGLGRAINDRLRRAAAPRP